MGDPLNVAIEHALTIREIVSRAEVKGEAFRRRARDFPSLMAEAGLAPALLFYLSKSKPQKIERALDALAKGPGLPEEELGKLAGDLKDELGAGEGAGYSIMVAAVVDALRKLGGIELARGGGGDVSTNIVKGLARLREERMEALAASILEPYLVELKKLADALFEKEKD